MKNYVVICSECKKRYSFYEGRLGVCAACCERDCKACGAKFYSRRKFWVFWEKFCEDCQFDLDCEGC